MKVSKELREYILKVKAEYEQKLKCNLAYCDIKHSEDKTSSINYDNTYLLLISKDLLDFPMQELNCTLYHEFTHLYDLEYARSRSINREIVSSISEIRASYIEMKYRLGGFENNNLIITSTSHKIKCQGQIIPLSEYLDFSTQNIFDYFKEGDMIGVCKGLQYFIGQLKFLEEFNSKWFYPKFYIQMLQEIFGDWGHKFYQEFSAPFDITDESVNKGKELCDQIFVSAVNAYYRIYNKFPVSKEHLTTTI